MPISLKLGDLIYRRNFTSKIACVRKVIAIEGDKVHCELLHGYRKNLIGKILISKIKNVRDWKNVPSEARKDLSMLDGCFIYENFKVFGPDDQLYFVCGEKKANFYIRKGYAIQLSDNEIKLAGWETIRKLESLHGENFNENPYFLVQKNKKCSVCGKPYALSRHHVVPERTKVNIPPEVRRALSNILFICLECHDSYEDHLIKYDDGPKDASDPVAYCLQWRDHFIRVMSPQYIPEGWQIFYPKILKGVKNEPERKR
jgi:hypothetical protein